MLDFIKTAMNTLAGPMGSVVDLAGDTLGLPPLLTNSIKVAAGAMTGNVMLAGSGAAGVASELLKNPPAQTEFCTCKDPARAEDGYARPSPTTPTAPAPSPGYMDPRVLEYRESLKTLAANFSVLDTFLGQKADGKISLRTLQAAALDPTLSPPLRQAARFLAQHPEYRHVADTASQGGRPDGTISQSDLQKALKRVNDDIARHGVHQPGTPIPGTPAPGAPAPGTPPGPGLPPPVGQPGTPPVQGPPPVCGPGTPGGSPPPSAPSPTPGGGGSLSDIIHNPHMSLEEKLQAILMLITRDTDEELLGVMQDMASLREERAGLGTDKKDQALAAKLETTMEQLNLRLQKLMEKRKQMFDLMSTLSSKFNEMAKLAIQNLGRA